MLPGKHDITQNKMIRAEGLVGKQFVLVRAMTLDDRSPEAASWPERHPAKTLFHLEAGTRVRVVQVILYDLITNHYYNVYVEVETGAHRGKRVRGDPLIERDLQPHPSHPTFCNEKVAVPYVGVPLAWGGLAGAARAGALMEGTGSSSWAIRWHAAHAARDMEGLSKEQAMRVLFALADDADRDVRNQVWKGITAWHPTDAESLRTVARHLTRPADVSGAWAGDDRDGRWISDRFWITNFLLEVGGRAALPVAESLSRTDLDSHGYRAAIQVLWRMGPAAAAAAPAAIAAERRAALANFSSTIPNTTALALKAMDKDTGIRGMEVLLRDPDMRVQWRAADVLLVLGASPEALLPVYQRLLTSENLQVRYAGIRGLGGIGGKYPELRGQALRALEASRREPVDWLREAKGQTILRLRRGGA